MVPPAAVGALGGGGLVSLVPLDTLLRWVFLAAHPAPDGVWAPEAEVVVSLAPVAPYRLLVIGAQVVCAPAAQSELVWRRALIHNKHLPGRDLGPGVLQSLGGSNVVVGQHCLQGEVEGVALEHDLAPLDRGVEQLQPSWWVPLLGQGSQQRRGGVVLGG